MDSTNDVTQEGMKHWKRCWLRANRCYKGLRSNLWKLTKIVDEMFDDPEFRADNGLRDDLAAAEWVDAKLSELPIGYLELRTIMHHYPDRESWEGTKLSKLRDSIQAAKPRPKRPRGAKPDVGQIKRERDFFKARTAVLEKRIKDVEAALPAETTLPEPVATEPVANAECVHDIEAISPAIDHAERLIAILKSGVDYEDSALIAVLEELKTTLEALLQNTIA